MKKQPHNAHPVDILFGMLVHLPLALALFTPIYFTRYLTRAFFNTNE
jgi:membrane protein insertase Oxa1/YidC/SpoIIIJ